MRADGLAEEDQRAENRRRVGAADDHRLPHPDRDRAAAHPRGEALDLRFRLRGALAPGGDIAIVQINDQSIAQEGRWPWSRLKFAEAVRWLDEAGARVVVFDLLFGEPQESVAVASLKKMRKAMARLGEAEPENRDTALAALRRQVEEIGDDFDPDGALADAIEAAGNVILPFSFIFRVDDDPLRSRARAASRAVGSWAYQGTRLAESEEPRLPLRADDLFPPVNRIAKRALSGGHVNVGRESDGTTRYEYPVLAYQGKYYPSLSVQAARAFLGIAPGEVVVTLNKGLQLGPLWLPTDDRMRMVVNFYGVGGTIPIHSFTDVVNGKKAPSHFADKIVLIGANATGIKDEFITPFSPNLSCTERLGIVIDNILQQRFIARQSYYPAFPRQLIYLMPFPLDSVIRIIGLG